MVPALRFTRNALQKVQTAAQRLDAVGIVGTSRYCCRTQLQSSCNGQECAQGILLGKKPKEDGERRVLQERQRLDELPLDLNLKVSANRRHIGRSKLSRVVQSAARAVHFVSPV